MVIRFFANCILTEKKRPPMVLFQLDMVHNYPSKQPQKSMDEKLSSIVAYSNQVSFISHKLVLPVGVRTLLYKVCKSMSTTFLLLPSTKCIHHQNECITTSFS
jgi:hypothetical protein